MTTIKQIKKSTGELNEFQLAKVVNSIAQAKVEDNLNPQQLADKAIGFLNVLNSSPESTFTTQQLKALIIRLLEEEDFPQTALKYQQFHKEADQFSNSTYNSKQQKLIENAYSKEQSSFTKILKQLKGINPQCQQIAELIENRRFLPHPNILRNKLQHDQETVVLQDDLTNIFDSLKILAINYQSLVSTCFNFSKLRPRNSLIKSTQGFSSGPVSFIKIFLAAFEALKDGNHNHQNLNQRIVLNIHHPDIVEFLIFVKSIKNSSINQHFNFLIELTPEFLSAAQQDKDFELISPGSSTPVSYLNANNTLEIIFSTIKENAQLGIFSSHYFPHYSQNHKQISSYINLPEYIENSELNSQSLESDLQTAQQYLNQFSSKNLHQYIYLTGFAEALILKETSYVSVQAIELLEQIISLATSISGNMGFGGNPIVDSIFETNPGLNPISKLVTIRSSLDGDIYYNLNKHLQLKLPVNQPELLDKINQQQSLSNLESIPEKIQQLFLTKKDISVEWMSKIIQIINEKGIAISDLEMFLNQTFSLDNLKNILDNDLANQFVILNNLEFSTVKSSTLPEQQEQHPNYLININKNRKKSTIQIQPPLFSLKKTKEIALPPISTNDD